MHKIHFGIYSNNSDNWVSSPQKGGETVKIKPEDDAVMKRTRA